MTTNQLIESGRIHEQAGDFRHAEEIYRRAVAQDPFFAEGWFRLGVIFLKHRNGVAAEEALRHVIELEPHRAEAWSNRGVALASQGRLEAAEADFRRAVELCPVRADLHRNLAGVFAEQGKSQDAVAALKRALELEPGNPAALQKLASIMRSSGNLEEAVTYLQYLLSVQPAATEAMLVLAEILAEKREWDAALRWFQRVVELVPDHARAHVGVGVALANKGQFEDAIVAYRRALTFSPESAEAHSNLGIALVAAGRDSEALFSLQTAAKLQPNHVPTQFALGEWFHRAKEFERAQHCFSQVLQLKPDHAEAHLHQGDILARDGRLDEAMDCFRQALRARPDYAEAFNSLGIVFERQGKRDDAADCFQKAIQILPDFPEAHCNLAVLKLLCGNWEEGFAEYEWRWRCSNCASRTFDLPLWDGSPLSGKSILLHAEQGRGDAIQFIRYAPLVRQLARRVVVACPPFLIALLSSCRGIDQFVSFREPVPDCDVRAPLMSLPGIMKSTPGSVPADIPYLGADADRVQAWQRKLSDGAEYRIGIAWSGNPSHVCDRYRSVSLMRFEPLSRVPGVRLYSLQKGTGSEDVKQAGDRFAVVDLGSDLDVAGGAFLDTAAVMKHLDLVITVDSALAHLAGALGVPVWLALSYAPDWRWLLDRDDTPWYPTMRLFRQRTLGDWDEVFGRMARKLRLELAGPLARTGRLTAR